MNKNVKIGKNVEISSNNNFGYHVILTDYSTVNNVNIDDYTSIGRNSRVFNANIGKYCSVSWNVTIGATSHPYSRITTHAFPYVPYAGGFVEQRLQFSDKNLEIGNDVWIGCNAIIMPNLKIGDGAIIGAGSVVTTDIEPYAICAGVPAKLIRYRFDSDTICRLLKLKWWDKDRNWILSNIKYFQQDLNDDILEILEGL